MGLDRRVDDNEVVIGTQPVDEAAEIGKAQFAAAAWNGSSALPP
jgi:hypothetical protein